MNSGTRTTAPVSSLEMCIRDSADGIPRFADLPDEFLEFPDAAGIGAEERIVARGRRIERLEHERSELRKVPDDGHVQPLRQIFSGDGPRRDAHDGFARR